MVYVKRVLLIFATMLVLVSNIGLGLAADPVAPGTSGTGGLKLTTATFADQISWTQLDAVKPLAGLIILILLFIYGLTLIAGPIAAGTKINIATITKSNDLRNEGQTGLLHIFGGLLLVCIALLGIFILWNNFGPGTW